MNENKIKTLSLRILHEKMYEQISELSEESKLSINMTINMLLGFALNEMKRQNKKFTTQVVFSSEEDDE